MNAIIYCRVSTNKAEQATSLKRQEEELLRLADEHNIQVVTIIREEMSGYEIDRDGVIRMLDTFTNHQANCLLIQDETRLGRGNTKIALLHQLQKLNISVYTSTDDVELQISDTDYMVLQIVSIVEAYERKINNMKIKRAMQRAIEKGFEPSRNFSNREFSPGRKRLSFPIEQVVALRKQNRTFDEITRILNQQGFDVSKATIHRRYKEFENVE